MGAGLAPGSAVSFWKTVFAVAFGVLIAGVVTWTAVEYRARMEAAAVVDALKAESEKAQRELDKVMAEQRQRQAEQRARDARRRAAIEAAKPPKYPVASADAKPGEYRCMHGYTVRRVENGWTEPFDPTTGKRYPCRVR